MHNNYHNQKLFQLLQTLSNQLVHCVNYNIHFLNTQPSASLFEYFLKFVTRIGSLRRNQNEELPDPPSCDGIDVNSLVSYMRRIMEMVYYCRDEISLQVSDDEFLIKLQTQTIRQQSIQLLSDIVNISRDEGAPKRVYFKRADDGDVNSLLDKIFGREKFVAIDFEWKPDRKNVANPIALVQISSGKACVVVRTAIENHYYAFPQSLINIFEREDIYKVFVGFDHSDRQKLQLHQPSMKYSSVIDLSLVANKYSLPKGIAKLSLELLGLKYVKMKKIQCSNWSQYYLSNMQKKYAVADAYLTYRVTEEMLIRNKISLAEMKAIEPEVTHVPSIKRLHKLARTMDLLVIQDQLCHRDAQLEPLLSDEFIADLYCFVDYLNYCFGKHECAINNDVEDNEDPVEVVHYALSVLQNVHYSYLQKIIKMYSVEFQHILVPFWQLLRRFAELVGDD